ncbi:MAG: 6-pyruvoyl tetrahydropterin synthase family protein [Planctomycetota bacterium]
MPDTYRVTLEKEELVFSAAHFITFNGDTCERLHGHNYRVRAEVQAALDENHYVIDFIWLRDVLKEITSTLDHRMLLPTAHAEIQVTAQDREVTATFRDRRWVFPAEDCIQLPIENTTAERLAAYILDQLEQRLPMASRPCTIEIAVEENFGQWGHCLRQLESA